MSIAVEAYELHMRERGLVAVSVERARAHLDKLLALDVNGSRPLRWLTERRAGELYESVQVGRAVDTHRNALAVGKKFGKYAAKRGWLASNPFAEVEPIGKRKRGKPQLRVNEARTLVDTCIAENSRQSIAVATALMLGMRASEIVKRQVRDLDDNGRLMWIPCSKTPAGKRHLEVPEVLRPALLRLATDRAGASFLFGVGDLDRPSRYWVTWHCRRICKLAGTPYAPPHGLRGTHATLATQAGQTSHAVSSALGHASTAITESTYIAPGERQAATHRAALVVLAGGNSPSKSDYQP